MLGAMALLAAGFLGSSAHADSPPQPGDVSFTASTLFPDFSPDIHDYVVRCQDGPVTVDAHTASGWEAAVGDDTFQSGDFSQEVPLGAGRSFTITVRQVGGSETFQYYTRCLPDNFPNYTFTSQGPVSPRFFAVDQFSTSFGRGFAIVFDNHGVPLWWENVAAGDTRVLPNGTILWAVLSGSKNTWEIHALDGTLLRTMTGVGHGANPHDLQILPNGDALLGSYVHNANIDTSAYGGSTHATVVNTELQRVTPGGQLAWNWKSEDHFSLAETGRHWPWAVNNGYDIEHWNSIEPNGSTVIASFRNLDAVYKINKATGKIVWKLGGTKTNKSLVPKQDPHTYTLGSQHDARLLPDGTLTVFDNRSNLGSDSVPEAVRFRIDQQRGWATLLNRITDPDVPTSNCCGSARRLGNGDWLIAWGQQNPIGGYKPDGTRTFLLSFNSNYSYRAEPVPSGAVTAANFRQGMDAMSGGP
jgi:hypothetical protein